MTELPTNLSDGLGALWLGEEEAQALYEVISSRSLFRHHGRGKSRNSDFESGLGSWLNTSVCTVSSGTAALKAALVALGITAGDSVLVSALTFIASASAVASLGAIPVPLDIDEFGGVDLQFASAVATNAKALILVYLPGHTSNTEAVNEFCQRRGIAMIEDASQALGVETIGGKAGTLGDVGVFSFQQGKQITSGEGGAVVSRSKQLINRARVYSDHGCFRQSNQAPHWDHELAMVGENYRMTELQAAVLMIQLRKLPAILQAQFQTCEKMLTALQKIGVNMLESHYPAGNSHSAIIVKLDNPQTVSRILDIASSKSLPVRYVWKFSFPELSPFNYLNIGHDFRRPVRAEQYGKTMLLVQTPPLNSTVQDSYARAVAACFIQGLNNGS